MTNDSTGPTARGGHDHERDDTDHETSRGGLDRRTVLSRFGATVAAATLAGCTGLGGQGTETETTTTARTQQPTATTQQPNTSTQTQTTAAATVRVRSDDEFGDVLVGPNGLSLYMFDNDTQGQAASTCYDSCAANWPPLTVDGDATAGDGVTAALTTFQREDGTTQVAADGWPLYYFAADEQPGDTAGQAVGDVWWLLRPDGAVVRDAGGATTTSTTTAGALDGPIRLGGRVSGWRGAAPSSIDGATNPTLTLAAGEQYELTWENLDGVDHELEILDDSGEDLVKTDSVERAGETASVTFTADPSMTEYVCEYHPNSMRGDVTVV